jgi:hypothetical protein
MAEVIPLAGGASAVAGAVNGILAAWDKIDTPRMIAMDVRNYTGHTIERLGFHFSHGGFGDPPASDHLDPNTAQLFQVRTVGGGVFTGVEGTIRWTIPDGAGGGLVAYFDNPWAGSNKGSAHVEGANSTNWRIICTVGSGDKAHFLYELHEGGGGSSTHE